MSRDNILTPGVERNLAELYIDVLVAEQGVDRFNGFYLLTVYFETGQQGDYLFNPNFNLVLSRYATPGLEAKNPTRVSGYKIDRIGREIDAHLSSVDKKETDIMLAKILQKTS